MKKGLILGLGIGFVCGAGLTALALHYMENATEEKEDLVNSAILVSDNFALIPCKEYPNDKRVYAVNMTRRNKKALVDVEDCTVLLSNMTKNMIKRAVVVVERNKDMILKKM